MSDDIQRIPTADLKLVLRNTEKASRDAMAALEATERLVVGVGARFDAMESRFDAMESRFATMEVRLNGLEVRMNGLERRVGLVEQGVDGIARSNHRIEQMLADILVRLDTPSAPPPA